MKFWDKRAIARPGAVIEFENGERHHYAPSSFKQGKFAVDGVVIESIDQLDLNMVVSHTLRGG